MIDLEKLQALTGEMAKPSRENQFERLEFTKVRADMKGYKLFYPAGQTKAKIKLLYNLPTGLVCRQVIKHQFTYQVINGRRFKVAPPCLKQYGMECPVCTITKNIQDIKGKDILTNVHKWSSKYIAFAYIEEISGHPETDSAKKINPGEVVLFMFPVTIFNKINDMLKECREPGDAEKFFGQNSSISFQITVNESKGTDMYSFMPDALRTSPIYPEPNGDIKYMELLNSLPSLYDIYLPEQPTDEIVALNREVADELSKRYLSNNTPDSTVANLIESEVRKQEALNLANQQLVTNTASVPYTPENPTNIGITTSSIVQQQVNQQAAAQVVQPTTTNINPTVQVNPTPVANNTITSTTTSLPQCFGNFNDIDAKCLICPQSTECSTKK